MLKLVLIAGLLITLPVFIGGCATVGEGEEQGSSIVPLIIFMAAIFGFFYFFMIRPQRKKQREHEELVQELRKGDQVITAGGIYGQIESLNDDSIVLKLESGSTIRVARSSVVGRRERK